MKKDTSRIRRPGLHGAYLPAETILAWEQYFFLQIIWNVAQEPLHSLRDELLPKYSAAFKCEQDKGTTRVEIYRLCVETLLEILRLDELTRTERFTKTQATQPGRALSKAAREMVAWSERFNLRGKRTQSYKAEDSDIAKSVRLQAAWPSIAALDTLFYWHFERHRRAEEGRGAPVWGKIINFPSAPVLDPVLQRALHHDRVQVEFESRGWNMGMETESTFRQRILRDFERWRDNHIAARIEAALAVGLVKVPGKRDLNHFIWTAMFQVGGASATKISRRFNVTVDAVESAIEGVLNLIQLERRAVKRGREPHRSASPE